MRAVRFNHVSISARDLEASVRFYCEVFGMERLAAPDFPHARVAWLRLGDQQLHLFESDDPGPTRHHLGLDVDDFEGAYRRARELGIIDHDTMMAGVYELADGAAQMYLRDPAGNLIELCWPDAATLDRDLFGPVRRLVDDRPQFGEAARARLYVN